MKNRLFVAAATAALLAAPSLASAQDDAGWYVRGNVGYGTHTDIDLTGDLVGDVESEGNIAGSVGVGYDFGNNWRLEGDLAQLWTDLGAISQIPNTSAKLETKTAFINAIYDFSEFGRWEPYIGAGLGLVRGNTTLTAHDFPSASLGTAGVQNVSNPACVGAVACSFKDGDTGLGWQLLAGLGYQISDSLTWDTHYRYTNSNNLDFVGTKAPSLGSTSAAAATMENVGAHAVMTGFRYKFGQKGTKMVKVPLPVAKGSYNCWDGSCTMSAAECPPEPAPEPVRTMQCWDGSVVTDAAQCPVQPAPQTFTCWDGSLVYDVNQCPVQQTVVSQYNICGPSPVAIFNVDQTKTPKNVRRLGTMPEFGDSHGLTPNQFFEKLQARYAAGGTDRAYLNYLFKSMGYTNGFRDAQSYMFSEETLPMGTTGILGLGEQHHYAYSVLNTSERDREAFRIQSANGSVVHFMKTCGNYMYACQ
ncbi:outer membrane protein [Fretibacter rubidus]|uniref:outer membrane protein n=1 Tax=Fretibacter rubidus TaxID=570162 RepID=UPI00352B8E3E